MRHERAAHVRFWSWENGGWVKVAIPATATQDDPVCHGTGGQTDEGWASSLRYWWRDVIDGEEWVYEANVDEGSDCDGGYSHVTVCRFRVADGLRPAVWDDHDVPGVMVPADWQRITASRRDQFAELAGY